MLALRSLLGFRQSRQELTGIWPGSVGTMFAGQRLEMGPMAAGAGIDVKFSHCYVFHLIGENKEASVCRERDDW